MTLNLRRSVTTSLRRRSPPRQRRAGAVRLSKVRRWSIYAVAAGVWLTGVAWLLWHYLLRTEGPFGPQASPLEAWWLKAHGLFAFASVWTLGLLWGVHVINGWWSGRRRWTGSILFGAALFLTVSGYLLYYVGSENARSIISYAHWILGSAAAVSFLVHRFAARGRRAYREERTLASLHEEHVVRSA